MLTSMSKRVLLQTAGWQFFGKWEAFSTTINEKFSKPDFRKDDHDEVEFGITKGEFRTRRRELVQWLVRKPFTPPSKPSVFDLKQANKSGDEEPLKHLVIVPTSHRHYMVEKIPYFYRPGTDLRYLTGSREMNTVLVLEAECDPRNDDQFDYKSILFIEDQDPKNDKWEGRPMERLEAWEKFGVDEVKYVGQLQEYLDEKRTGQSAVFRGEASRFVVWFEHQTVVNEKVHNKVVGALTDGLVKGFRSPKQGLHDIRVIKSPAEIELMRKTGQIASESIKQTIKKTKELKSESEVFATVDYLCRMKGADYLAYPPVVAAGDHANAIHYTKNSHDPVNRNDLMLMDAGCEFGGYTSDVTRTWPLSGKFESEGQKMVYDAVFDVQSELIKILKSGTVHNGLPVTIDSLYYEMQRLFRPHLINLGLITGQMDEVEGNLVVTDVCPHHVSHYLGMDVHDTPLVSRNVPLVPGMVITLEPGLYFPKNRLLNHVKAIPDELKGIGVRLEDDILITSGRDGVTTCEVLSSACPKSRAEIEALIE